MKNLSILCSANDVRDFVGKLWQSADFRRLHAIRGSYVERMVDVFSAKPRIFYDMDDPVLERNHFTAMMNAVQLRSDYTNQTLADMYYLHEITHLNTIRYDSSSDLYEWSGRSLSNELKATIETEVVVYFAIPDLRVQTFPFEIWADRFLASKVLLSSDYTDNHRFFSHDPKGFRAALMRQRWKIRHNPTPGDKIEAMISGYTKRNDAWDQIWSDAYSEIEARMEEFEQDCEKDRRAAIESLANWLLSKKRTGICPFQKQAEDYVRIAAEFKKQFADQSVEAAQRKDDGMSTI
jgi:hypothetical protein